MRFFGGALLALVALGSVGCTGKLSGANDDPGSSVGYSDPIPNGGACGEEGTCVPYSTDLTIVIRGERRSCPIGYDFGEALVQFPDGELPPAQCSCECGTPTTHASCTSGGVSIGVSLDDGTCNKASGIASGVCQTTLAGDAAYAKATALPPQQESCAAAVTKVGPPAITRVPFHTCKPRVDVTGACDLGLVCLPSERPAEAAACVPVFSEECPAEYPTLLRLTDGVKDERDCGGCQCETTDTCANARLEFHDPADPNCSKAAQTSVPADGLCHPTGYTTSWLEYKADVVASSSCKVTKPSASIGGVFAVAGQASSYLRNFCCR